jgi:hypothetical protein
MTYEANLDRAGNGKRAFQSKPCLTHIKYAGTTTYIPSHIAAHYVKEGIKMALACGPEAAELLKNDKAIQNFLDES